MIVEEKISNNLLLEEIKNNSSEQINFFWLGKQEYLTCWDLQKNIHELRKENLINDVVLLVGYKEEEVVGFLGILPDKCYFNKEELKLGWLTSWWVNPRYINSGIGAVLLLKAIEYYDSSIGFVGFNERAKLIYDASGKFTELKELEGAKIVFSSNLREILPNMAAGFKKFRWLLALVDSTANILNSGRFHFWQCMNKRKLSGIRLEYISRIDEETKNFIERHNENELTKRNSKELNWILKCPWVLSAPLTDQMESRYYFSYRAERFSYISVKVLNEDGEMIGFIIFKLRDRHLTIPYIVFDSDNMESIIGVIGQHIMAMKPQEVTIFNEVLVEFIFAKGSIPYLYRRKRARSFYISSKFNDLKLENVHLHDGDGDCIFT